MSDAFGQSARIELRVLQGPDFEVGKVVSATARPDGSFAFTLATGSAWIVPKDAPEMRARRNTVQTALEIGGPVFVSGRKAEGAVEWATVPQRMAPMSVGPDAVNGKLPVAFRRQPSMYFLRVGRPWFSRAKELIANTIREAPDFRTPDLLVSVDVVTFEILDVREL